MAHTATTRAEAFDPLEESPADYARKCWGLPTETGEQQPVSWRGFHLASNWFDHVEHNDVEAFFAWLPIHDSYAE